MALENVPPEQQQEIYNLLGEWYGLQDQLAQIKEREMQLRKQMFAAFFPTTTEGTAYVELAAGWKLKGVGKIDYGLVAETIETILDRLPRGVVQKVIRYKPALVLGEYRKLAEEHRLILAEGVTAKPGAPTLEMIPPKPVEQVGEATPTETVARDTAAQ